MSSTRIITAKLGASAPRNSIHPLISAKSSTSRHGYDRPRKSLEDWTRTSPKSAPDVALEEPGGSEKPARLADPARPGVRGLLEHKPRVRYQSLAKSTTSPFGEAPEKRESQKNCAAGPENTRSSIEPGHTTTKASCTVPAKAPPQYVSRMMTQPKSKPVPKTKPKGKLPKIRPGPRDPALTPLAQRRLRLLGFTSPRHDWMTRNLGRELASLNHDTLDPFDGAVTCASGFELVCSYNWARPRPRTPPRDPDPGARARWRAMPTDPLIFVPGEAPRLVPRRIPYVSGGPARRRERLANYRDVNQAMAPRWPFEPLFRAVGVMRPGFRFDEVDAVLNRNTLKALLKIGESAAVSCQFIIVSFFYLFVSRSRRREGSPIPMLFWSPSPYLPPDITTYDQYSLLYSCFPPSPRFLFPLFLSFSRSSAFTILHSPFAPPVSPQV